MSKVKWMIIGLIDLVALLVIVFLVRLGLKNIFKSNIALLITYWKEYAICLIILALCYLGIKIVTRD